MASMLTPTARMSYGFSSLAIDLDRALPGHRFYPAIVAFNWQLLTHLVSVNVSLAKVAPTS
jgi:hypothetical protein